MIACGKALPKLAEVRSSWPASVRQLPGALLADPDGDQQQLELPLLAQQGKWQRGGAEHNNKALCLSVGQVAWLSFLREPFGRSMFVSALQHETVAIRCGRAVTAVALGAQSRQRASRVLPASCRASARFCATSHTSGEFPGSPDLHILAPNSTETHLRFFDSLSARQLRTGLPQHH